MSIRRITITSRVSLFGNIVITADCGTNNDPVFTYEARFEDNIVIAMIEPKNTKIFYDVVYKPHLIRGPAKDIKILEDQHNEFNFESNISFDIAKKLLKNNKSKQ